MLQNVCKCIYVHITSFTYRLLSILKTYNIGDTGASCHTGLVVKKLITQYTQKILFFIL